MFGTGPWSLERWLNMVDAAGSTKYTYTAGNQLLTEDGPFASDTLTNTYCKRPTGCRVSNEAEAG